MTDASDSPPRDDPAAEVADYPVDLGDLGDIRFVLVDTSHPGNIGASARALVTMGFDGLHLVKPYRYPAREAVFRAAGGAGALERAPVHAELAPAIDDCVLVCGLSARSRRVDHPVLTLRDAAPVVLDAAQQGPVALLFGREARGLTNAELERCHYRIEIPGNPAYPILNLAMAVQLTAWELRQAAGHAGEHAGESVIDPRQQAWDQPPASSADVEYLLDHLHRVLVGIDFIDADNPGQVPNRLRRLFQRLRLDRTEVGMLRGILTQIEQWQGGLPQDRNAGIDPNT